MYEYASAKTVDFSEIPVISVANISRPDQLHNCGEAIVKAAGNVGFFYIVDHGISPQLRADAFAAAAEFFSLDADNKASIAVNQHQRGWMAQGLTRLEGSVASDAKEVFSGDVSLMTRYWPEILGWLRPINGLIMSVLPFAPIFCPITSRSWNWARFCYLLLPVALASLPISLSNIISTRLGVDRWCAIRPL